MTRRIIAGVGVALLATCVGSADAKPEYAAKEKKECSFCHINPSGGGERNSRGQYYAKNKYSLVGLPIAFKSAWKLEAPAGARRVALGDVMGDKKPRVLVLDTTDEVAVMNIAEGKLVKETAVKLGPKAGSLYVGAFEKGKPAVIAVPGSVHYRSGDAFTSKPAPELSSITGTVRFEDGEECVFLFESMSEPAVFGVDTSKTNPLTVGRGMVLPDQGAGIYASVVARLSPEMVAMLGFPEQVQQAGIFGLWDPRADGSLFAWAPWSDANGTKLVFLDPGVVMGGGELKPSWQSEKLAGKVLDAVVGKDPKDGKTPGILLLMASGDGGKGRTLEFLALD